MAIDIVDFPIKNGGSFHSYVKLPEGISNQTGAAMDTHPDSMDCSFSPTAQPRTRGLD